VIKQAVNELVAPGLLILATRTGFTRSEIIGLTLRRFISTVMSVLPKE
jgi:hypothetical protein